MLKLFLITGLIFLCTAGAVYLLFFAKILDVRTIDISGAEIASQDELKAAVENWLSGGFWGIERNRNLLFLSVRGLVRELTAKFPRIDFAEAKKELPHGLKISITERKPAGIWCFVVSAKSFGNTQDKCFYFDKSGVAYAESGWSSGFLVLNVIDYRGMEVNLGSRVASEEGVGNIIIAKKLLPKIGIDAAEFSIPSGSFDEFDAETAEGWKILFSNSTDIAKQITSLGILFRDKLPAEKRTGLQYIDLRIQDRIYYK